jgi:hypothetical protein
MVKSRNCQPGKIVKNGMMPGKMKQNFKVYGIKKQVFVFVHL